MLLFRCGAASVGTIGVILTANAKYRVNNNIHAQVSPSKVPPSTVIIGGGVIGLSTALRLSEKGCKVTLLEAAASVPGGTSRVNGGVLCPSMVTCWANPGLMYQRKYVRKSMKVSWRCWLDPGFYRWGLWFWFNTLFPGRLSYNQDSLTELTHYSIKCLGEEEEKFGKILGQNKTAIGTLKLFQDQQKMESFLSSDLAMYWKEKGKEFQRLTVEECLRLEPALAGLEVRKGVPDNSDLVGGVRCEIDSSGDIYVYCKNVEKECVRRGVEIRYGARVDSLEVEDGEVTGAKLKGGEMVRGDYYVVAAGVASTEIAATAGVNLPIVPIKGHLATVRSRKREPVLTHTIDSQKHGIICPLSPNVIRLSGGMEIVGHDHSIDEEKGKLLVENAEGALRENYIDRDDVVYDSGLRPVSGDDVPMIGLTHLRNLWINTGHGSKGWTLSWGSSALLADLMCGEEAFIDKNRFSPLRFHPIRRVFRS